MNHLQKSYNTIQDNVWIWLTPLVLALGSFFWSTAMGLWPMVQTGGFMKFTVSTGLPNMSQILNINQYPLAGGNAAILGTALAALVGFALDAFISGAWLAGVFKVLGGEKVTLETLADTAQKFWLRLFLLRVINLMVMTFILLPLGSLMPPISLVLLFGVMVYTFYWQLAIVREDVGVLEGLDYGWRVFRSHVNATLSLALLIGLITLLVSIMANGLAQNMVTFPLAALLWSYVGSVLSVALCSLYEEIRHPL